MEATGGTLANNLTRNGQKTGCKMEDDMDMNDMDMDDMDITTI